MVRREDWPAKLAEQIEGARRRPFCYGEHDCFMFAANVVLAMTGDDPARDLRGVYSDERSALITIARYGSLQMVAVACFGAPSDAICARRGDVVMVNRSGVESLAVVLDHRVAAPGALGLEFGYLSEALCCWRV